MSNNFFKDKLKIIYNWFNDELFLKLLNNAKKLFGGDLVRHIFRLISVSLTARALGPEIFGQLVLIRTYTRIIDRFVNFQSWQGVIKFGTEYENKDREKFRKTVRICTHIDILSAIFGMILSWCVLQFVSDIYQWNTNITYLSYLYTLTILFNLEGTPKGILRIYDKYKIYAYQRITTSTIQLVIIIILFLLGITELSYYLIAFLITKIIQHLFLFYFGWRELFKKGIDFSCLKNISFKNSKNLLKFITLTNLQGSVKLGAKQLPTMLIGYLLGSKSVGLFDIAKKFSSIIGKISNPIYQAIYPDLSELWSKSKISEFKNLIFRSSLSIGFVSLIGWILLILFGNSILIITVGKNFIDAYPILIWYTFGVVISIFSIPIQPAILSMNRADISLYAILISTIIYLGSIFILTDVFGLVGVGISYVLFYIIWALYSSFFVIRGIRKKRKI